MNPSLAPRLRVIAAAFLFSTGGAAIKACSLSSFQIAGLRSAIAAVALLMMLPEARRAKNLLNPRTLLISISYAATMILFVTANKLTTAASTIFLQSTAPFYLLLLGPWLLREPTRRRDLGFMAVLAAGMVLFFWGTDQPLPTAPRPLAGNVAAALTGLTWALTVTGLRWTARSHSNEGGDAAASVVVVGNLLAAAAVLPWAVPLENGGTADLLIVLYLGIFQIGLAYVFLTTGIRRVGALEASLLLLVEPVFSPFWAWIAHGEVPGVPSLIGGGVILTAIAFRARLDARG